MVPTCLAFILLWSMPSTVWAAIQEAAGVDLVVVIDQSGSMAGKGKTRVANDRYNKRISFLNSFRDNLLQFAQGAMTSRISVVEYGGRYAKDPQYRPQVTLASHVIPPVSPLRNEADVDRDIGAGLDRIEAVDRGDTDHPEALRLAADELRRFAAEPLEVPPGGKPGMRQKLVVLITDGHQAFVAGAQRGDTLTESWLVKETEEAAALFPDDAQFVVFGLNDASDYWSSGWGERWRKLATSEHAYLVASDTEMIPKIMGLLGDLLSMPTTVADYYVAPPYLKALRLVVDFLKPGVPVAAIEIARPDGSREVPAQVNQSANGFRFTVPWPAPGKWTLRDDPDAPFQVLVTEVKEQAALVAPVSPLAQDSQTPIRYRLTGRGPGGLFVAEPSYPVRFEVTVVDPSGQETVYTMREESPGHIVSRDDLKTSLTGEYRLRLSGKTTVIGAATTEVEVYESGEPGGDRLLVNESVPVSLRIETPAQDEITELHWGSTVVPVRARFFNERNGKPLAPAEVLRDGVTLRLGLLEDPATAPVDLAATGEALEAAQPLALERSVWRYLLQSGDFRIRIQAPADPFKEVFYYRGVAGGETWVSPPYAFRESRLTLIVLGVAATALPFALGLLWWFFGTRWWVAWQDRRERQRPSLTLRLPETPQNHHVWDLTGRRVITGPRSVELGTDDVWEVRDFKVRRKASWGPRVAVRLHYRPRGERTSRKSVDLWTINDDANARNASSRVEGLGREAYFTLFRGKATEARW